MSYTEKDIKRNRDEFDSCYAKVKEDIDNCQWHSDLSDFGNELMESFRDKEVIDRVEYQPEDDLRGSLSIYLTFLPSDHYIKIWGHHTKVGFSFYRKLAGAMELQIPDTFNESGILTVASLDEFLTFFISYLATKSYNKKYTIIYK